ncbi:MAG: DUF6541 family protein, partial [Nitrosopumilaceae archaeon]
LTIKSTVITSPTKKYIIATVITVIIWALDSPLGLFYYTGHGLGIMVSELNKAEVIVETILVPFLVALPLIIFSALGNRGHVGHSRARKLPTILVVLVLLVSTVSIIPMANSWMIGNYNGFAVASNNDYNLLLWMRNGIPNTSVILINPYDAGAYVPSISMKEAVGLTFATFAGPPSSAGPLYQKLFQEINDQVFNTTTISLIRSLNATYVFLGSHAYQDGWTTQYFLDRPLYFELVKNYGDAYLFSISFAGNRATIN